MGCLLQPRSLEVWAPPLPLLPWVWVGVFFLGVCCVLIVQHIVSLGCHSSGPLARENGHPWWLSVCFSWCVGFWLSSSKSGMDEANPTPETGPLVPFLGAPSPFPGFLLLSPFQRLVFVFCTTSWCFNCSLWEELGKVRLHHLSGSINASPGFWLRDIQIHLEF